MVTFARPASRTTAKVLDSVRAAILSGELAPGEQVRQQVWAERCGVSRPPVREALEILSNEGLLVHGLNQGYFVTKFSTDEMDQLYTMRHLLELEAIRTLVWPEADTLADLRRRAHEIESAADAGRPDFAMQAVAEFFLEIYRLCPRKLIVAEIERLWIRTAAYRALNYDVMAAPRGVDLRFQEVIDALGAQDRDALAELLQRPTLRGMRRARGGAEEPVARSVPTA
ncbi:GntR family transcriptional regulator [Streptomyces sp. NBC_00582]|uniref:GntR family transcriptional regulator n=1 Tax=Streptomyces sp. NBC_00582 TaxID=2975783 RepID=UPI0010626C31|nr:GntR family transcriptional regulator [Streptomyces sp. NBC_00582]WUB66064.1 GntR family transcriptional regulator [Streptomyces sp. NBC_00582]